ncbi:MAG: hypothetical protein EZS28_024424 [Streblomastix strix]|uniref:Uncharacterized protein n=1 Tax=Streblomastix strix TaxID=222440 RepID=A0A5J4VBZ6_9EUKA|nr:MAG: hypothetical protein EZS28_024424 [Streblomastix strix]
MTQKRYNQQKQQDRNLEIDSEDIEIGPYHSTSRDQDMTLLTEEANQEKDQVQEVIQDLENTRVQEKLEWMSIGIRMDLKLETNQEAEAEEHIEEGNIVIKEGDRTIGIEIYRIRRDIEKHRSITHTQNGSLARLRIQQTGTGHTNMMIKIEEKAGMITQMMIGQNKRTQMQKDQINNHSDRDSTWTEDEIPQLQNTIDISTTKVTSPSPGIKKKGRIDQPPNQDDIDEQEIMQEKLAALQKEKEQYNISDSDNDRQKVIGEIDNNNNLTPKQAQKQLQEMIQQSIFSKIARQQQQTARAKAQKRIVSPLPRMINTGMNKDKSNSQIQVPASPTQIQIHRSEIEQRKKQAERELELLQSQQLQQQQNNDLNNTIVDIPDIQGTVGQLTGLQPSSDAQNLGLNAGPRLKEAGSISASNRE